MYRIALGLYITKPRSDKKTVDTGLCAVATYYQAIVAIVSQNILCDVLPTAQTFSSEVGDSRDLAASQYWGARDTTQLL